MTTESQEEVVDAGSTPAGAEPDFMSMSDEDWQNFNMPATVVTPEPSGSEGDQGDDEAAEAERLRQEEEAANAANAGNEGGEKSEEELAQEEADRVKAEADAAAKEQGEKPADDKKPADDQGNGEAKPDAAGVKGESEAVDWNAVMTQPITANGRKLKIETPEDAIALMQMGANYSKKMAAIKPNLKMLKMLETNGLLSEEQISFFIDVSKKDPAAISKLVADSKIDPLDISAEKAGEYKPGNHRVSEQEMQLDAVLGDIKESPHYNATLKLVSTDWDDASRQVVVAHPGVMKIIEGHMANGAYDIISEKVEQERMFGRLQGVSDIEAYKQVSDAIAERGGFAHLSGQPAQKAAPAKIIATPKPSKADDDKLRDQKRAAGGTKAISSNKAVPADLNIMAMSDADFAAFKFH